MTLSHFFSEDPKNWIVKAMECNQLGVLERIKKVEELNLNKFNREQILDEPYPFFFDSSLLYFPVETIKRVLNGKLDKIFPEYASDPQSSSHIKWILRLEIIQKFCQLSETLAAHLMDKI